MSYPIPLKKYDKIMNQVIPARTPYDTKRLVKGNPDEWEIIGFTSTNEVWMIWLGHIDPISKVASSQPLDL